MCLQAHLVIPPPPHLSRPAFAIFAVRLEKSSLPPSTLKISDGPCAPRQRS
ncbi:uncharacterized protein CANTADRAFT_26177, partial [Suhomyces tanzawaensis NRRL Y-17324]